MAILKKHMISIVLAVVSLGSVGVAAWGYLSGNEIIEQMDAIDRLRREVQTSRSNAANLQTIEMRKKQIAEKNVKMSHSLEVALEMQKTNAFTGQSRQVLIPDALPTPKSPAARIDFKEKYQREFDKLRLRLRARDRASKKEIDAQKALIENKKKSVNPNVDDPWRPDTESDEEDEDESKKQRTLKDVLRDYPRARAAEIVARSINMYLDKNAIRPHQMVRGEEMPNAVKIWQAQMLLWIQQDIVEALARLNDERADELKAAGRSQDLWVANMPVKRLKILRVKGWLGRGGGSNSGKFAVSWTRFENDKTKFLVPLQIDLIVEESSLMKVIESLCKIGFYTPTQIRYRRVEPNRFQDDYIYGEDPVLKVTIDLEAYYFRKVFEDWIPNVLKKILATPKAEEEKQGRR